mmetsp:Transcript_36218/g.59069  ORF Transcript_36218/g.59069 Transcript_36218/m.59069 type:complete len:234 (+) Transcript_36218:3-704(+)
MVALILGLDPDNVVSLKAPTNNHLVGGSKKAKPSTQDSSFNSNTLTSANQNTCKEKTVLQYRIPQNAALLYRLSGDYNRIHVEDDLLGSDEDQGGRDGISEQKTQKSGAVLHGLCTMGYALRAVLHHADHHQISKSHGGEVRLASVRCNFVKPVYVGDSLRVEVWDEEDRTSRDETGFDVCFRVYRDVGRACSGVKQIDIEKQSDVVVDKGKARFCLCSKRLGTEVVRTVSRL